ncbi:MAG: UDP-N-acetylmuramyl peptide synthase, partial [Coriobacteriales bacterium]|nr:UDP-N-acetylmuramyl peptide synthase [Coriobacteriales bacterium]
LKIFEQAKVSCVYLGTSELDRVLEAAKASSEVITFGLDQAADVYAYDFRTEANGSHFKVHFPTGRPGYPDADFKLSLLGSFNIINALAALSAAWSLAVPLAAMQAGLAEATVPGRMECFSSADGKLIIVDYAHNLMSFEALFAAFKNEYPAHHYSIVFGCPGYKAYDRRRDLGLIAGREADDIILTEEDPGAEPLEQICAEIAEYVREAGKAPRIILEREEAICAAIDSAPVDSIILITGKGRETRQKRGSEYIEVRSDVQIVEGHLQKTQ